MPTKPRHTRIVSNVPGRTRIKVSRKRRTKKEMERLARELEKRLHGVEAHPDPQTGSILVRHPHSSLEDITSILKDLGVILGTVSGIDLPLKGGETKVASDIKQAISDLDRRLGHATNGLVNLRILLPLGLGTLAVLQLVRRGLQIEAAPWYVLAYAAFHSFVVLNPPANRHDPVGQNKE